MGKSKWYAVRRGHQTGVFSDWPTTQRMVNGFSGADYKAFTTQADAEAYLTGEAAPAPGLSAAPRPAPAAAASRGGAGGKWFAIAAGRQTGVFQLSWQEVQDAVVGYSGATFKGFSSKAEAAEWLARAGAAPGPSARPQAQDPEEGGEEAPQPRGQQPQQRLPMVPAASRASGVKRPLEEGAAAAGGGAGEAGPAGARHAHTSSLAATASRGGASSSRGTPGRVAMTVFYDGASRGNPGRAAYGYVVRGADGAVLFEGCRPLAFGSTNNQAEYSGLIAGLRRARQLGATHVKANGDSQLVDRQLSGRYQVKSELLRPLHQQAAALKASFAGFELNHVYREDNRQADALANLACDVDAAVEAVGRMPPGSDRSLLVRVVAGAAQLSAEDAQELQDAPDFFSATASLLSQLWDQCPMEEAEAALRAAGWSKATGSQQQAEPAVTAGDDAGAADQAAGPSGNGSRPGTEPVALPARAPPAVPAPSTLKRRSRLFTRQHTTSASPDAPPAAGAAQPASSAGGGEAGAAAAGRGRRAACSTSLRRSRARSQTREGGTAAEPSAEAGPGSASGSPVAADALSSAASGSGRGRAWPMAAGAVGPASGRSPPPIVWGQRLPAAGLGRRGCSSPSVAPLGCWPAPGGQQVGGRRQLAVRASALAAPAGVRRPAAITVPAPLRVAAACGGVTNRGLTASRGGAFACGCLRLASVAAAAAWRGGAGLSPALRWVRV